MERKGRVGLGQIRENRGGEERRVRRAREEPRGAWGWSVSASEAAGHTETHQRAEER